MVCFYFLRQQRRDQCRCRECTGSGRPFPQNGQYFVIGIPTCQFAFRDENYLAISPDAPFYLPLINKKPNDHFEYGSKLYNIEAVY